MRTIVTRISLIVAIITGVTVIQFHLNQLKTKMTTMHNALAAQTAAREKADADFVSTREVANKTTIALKRTADALEAKSAEAAVQAQQIANLNEDRRKLRQERDDAQAELSAYRVSMPTPKDVANAANKIKTLQDSLLASQEENALLGRQVKRLESLVPNSGGNPPIALPADLNAKVLVLDSKWG